jgi:polyketide synthase PksJ
MGTTAEKLPRDSVQDILDLTPLQEGLLFHYLKDPQSVQYHEQLCLNIAGDIDQQLFQQAWQHVIHTNEMLRTVFRWQGLKKPVQIILKQAAVHIAHTDLSHLDQQEQHRLIEEAKKTDRARPFNLMEGAFRIHLYKLSTQQSLMLVSNHHILYDGWSNGIILSEFFDNYQCLQNNKPLPMSTKTPFKTYCQWLQSQDHQRQAQFWRTYLQGFYTQTTLPLQSTRESALKTSASHTIVCAADIKQQLETFCRKHEVTLAAVLYTAWGLVLQKYTRTNDVVFGTTVSGRTADIADMLNMVGLFINTIPLRVQGTQEQTILDVIQQVNTDLIARKAFETTSLVDIQGVSDLETRDELFHMIMVIENYPLNHQLLHQQASLSITDFSLTEMTHYDLTVMANLLFDSLEFVFTFIKERFDETAIVRLADCFRTLLTTLVEHPFQRLREIDIISSQEKEQILTQFNTTARTFTDDQTLHGLFTEQAEKYARRPAILCEGEVLTYRELHERSSRLAAYLLTCGIENETIIGVCAERSLDMMVGILAILQAGGAYLPLDPRLPEERVRYILEDSGAKMVLCQEKYKAVPGKACTVLCLEDADLYELPPADSTTRGCAENLAYIIYTSGSTGKPKGVLIEHRSVMNRLRWAQRYFHLNEEDVILQKTNIMFDVSMWELFGWMFSGAALCLLQPGAEADPGTIIETIARARVTTIHFVPSMFQLFLDYLQVHQAGEQLQSLQRIITSGESLRARQLALSSTLLPEITVTNLYGPTEATIDVSYYQCVAEDSQREHIPIGKPIANIRLYVLNDSHTLQPIGVPGELCIAGVGIARGYINAPELTARKFVQDPFYPAERMYKTGDLARWLPNGDLEYLGRLDHQVKMRGFRVELQEIEAHLLQLPEIKEAIVVVIKDTAGDDRLLAYYIPRPQAKIDERAIREALARKLPDFMIPDLYRELEHFPLTLAGKVDRNRLLHMALNQKKSQPVPGSPDPELNAVERAVAEIWADVLGVEQVKPEEVFFEIGGNSLKIIRVCSRLMSALQVDLPVTALFQYPTVRALARHIVTRNQDQPTREHPSISPHWEQVRGPFSGDVAVIGMAGRFPGAQNLDLFWENLKNGVESISFLSPEEIQAEGIPAHLLENPRYVRAKGMLEGVEYFDAAFFGYSPKEAEVMDPQLRILHECVWQALEDAGHNPETYAGAIGLYAGSSPNFRWLQKIEQRSANSLDDFSLMLLNEKDFFSSRIAYKMNLKGPAVTIQTACSTSLAAIHHAYQGLLTGQCDMAIAAGVSVTYPVRAGYLYEEGMVFSPDGHCRAFDALAQGTVGGNGVGAVVLKRLEDAQQQGDHIYSVIKGSALNNDGFSKVGFTAPSIDGQAGVIAQAQARAGVTAESITYIEAHGTGTALGDPIELAALTQAFQTTKQHFCAIGSVKTNIGHLDAAAGIAGFIKTSLALKHAQLPPSLHFERANPKSNLDQSPFYVITRLSSWQRGDTPLRAGVSSFGMGGTNVHVVLEEQPEAKPQPRSTEWQVLPLSAKTAISLQKAAAQLSAHLRNHPELNLADVAYTLQVGRKTFDHRLFVVCSTLEDAVRALDEHEPPAEEKAFPRSSALCAEEARGNVVFFFPGQGSQHINMGADLYKHVGRFQEEVDRCFALLRTLFHLDLQPILSPEGESIDDPSLINQTVYTQPLLFIYEYALAQLLISWGIRPGAMIGHSLGEYVAACLAGVFSLEDALKLVVWRARLMQELPTGSMISVPLPEQELKHILPDQLSIAAVNSKTSCVVSGPTETIQSFARELKAQAHDYRPLITSHAFHSDMMMPMLDEFYRVVVQVTLQCPRIPYISNITGTWIRDDEATNPDYWVKHIHSTVRFSEGVEQLLTTRPGMFVEVGPGRVLTELVKKNLAKDAGISITNLCRHPLERVSDVQHLFHRVGELWSKGMVIDWERLHNGSQRHRVSLPTYAFEAQRFWPDDRGERSQAHVPAPSVLMETRQKDMADWFSVPSWERTVVPVYAADQVREASWMLFALRNNFCDALVCELRAQHAHVTVVYPGERFEQITDREFTVDPRSVDDFKRLLEQTRKVSGFPGRIIHLWSSTEEVFSQDMLGPTLNTGFYALVNLAKALGELQMRENVRIVPVTSGIEQVTGRENLCPGKATLYGFTKICPIEYPHIECKVVDLDPAETRLEWGDELIKNVLAECMLPVSEISVAYRAGYRWNKAVRASRLEISPLLKQRLRERGVYLITGGLGGIGFALATYLAEELAPTLVLVGRSAFPERSAWPDWLEMYGPTDKTSKKILALLELEAHGARVGVYSADIANEAQVARLVREVEHLYGLINGVIHAAGVADYAGMLQTRSIEATATILAPKIQGTLLLDRFLNPQELDFFVLCSSIGNVIYQQKFGQSGYNAANEFLDAYVYFRRKQGKTFWVSINWSDWQEVGMSLESAAYWAEKLGVQARDMLSDGVSNAEGIEAFQRILSGTSPQVIVSPQALAERASKAVERFQTLLTAPQTPSSHTSLAPSSERSVLSIDELENILAQLWQAQFGVTTVGLHENFFDLGADSFDLVQANSALQQRFAIEVPLVALYEHPTIASLARFIRTELLGNTDASAPADTKELDKAKSLLKQASSRMKKK